MRILLLLTLLFFSLFCLPLLSQDLRLDWECGGFGDPFVSDCHFISADTGFVVTEDGNKVFITEVGFPDYRSRKVALDKPYRFTNIHMMDYKTGIIVGFQESMNPFDPGGSMDGIIIKSYDQFQTFSVKYRTPGQRIYSLYFQKNNKIGFAMGEVLLRTENGGERWNPIEVKRPNGKNIRINEVMFLTDELGFAAADAGCVFKTTDAGKNWFIIRDTKPGDTLTVPLSGIHFRDEMHGVISGAYGASGIVTTADGGKTWKGQLEIDGRRDWHHYKMTFPTPDIGFMYGGFDFKKTPWAYTHDGGQTWHLAGIAKWCGAEDDYHPELKCMCFGNAYTGYAMGIQIGYRTRSGGNPVSRNLDPVEDSPIRILPNPANDLVAVSCESNKAYDVQLFNLMGQSLQSGRITNNICTFDVKELPSGVYVIRIAAQDGSQVLNRKLVIRR